MSFNWWTNEQTVTSPYPGIVLSNEKEQTVDTCDVMDESKVIVVSERSKIQKTTPHTAALTGPLGKVGTVGRRTNGWLQMLR
jgi:hypothetical protein